MAERWVEVRLGGYLGREFGRSHKFLVEKPQEAVRALCKQIKGVKNALDTAHLKGVRFAVFNGKHNIKDVEELSLGCKDMLRILPIYEGSKRQGLFTTILGVVLSIAAGVAGAFGFGAVGVPLAKIGLAMILGGVVQMLSPQPQGLKTSEDADNTASYAFGGPTNTTAQGTPIALFYGEREVGGAVISASILAEDQA